MFQGLSVPLHMVLIIISLAGDRGFKLLVFVPADMLAEETIKA